MDQQDINIAVSILVVTECLNKLRLTFFILQNL